MASTDPLARIEQALNSGDLDRAERLLRKLPVPSRRQAEGWYYLGTMLVRQGQYERALDAIQRSLAMAGDFFEGLHDLAVLMTRTGRAAEALPLFDRAQAIQPQSFELLNNKGIALNACKRYEEALHAYGQAMAIKPDHPFPWLNKGVSLEALGEFSEAMATYRKALELKPEYVEAWCNLGNVACRLNLYEEALGYYARALSLSPEDADSLYGQSLALLTQGDFKQGLKLFEFRWAKTDADAERHRSIPKWLGNAPLAGKRILLWSEQGYGDTVQFCRYAPLVARLGADVVLEVPPTLRDLVSTVGDCTVVSQLTGLRGFDYQTPLLSLPLALGTTVDSIPRSIPYLKADQKKTEEWSRRLGVREGKRSIAIACSGRATQKNERQRLMPLEHFAALLEHGDVFLVQKELREQDRATLARYPEIRFLGPDIQDFADTAAIVASVDLTISVDTSLVHVAGALGAPVWMLLSWAPDWRWLIERTDSPWYPSAKLFRQDHPVDWRAVIDKVVRELRSERTSTNQHPHARPD